MNRQPDARYVTVKPMDFFYSVNIIDIVFHGAFFHLRIKIVLTFESDCESGYTSYPLLPPETCFLCKDCRYAVNLPIILGINKHAHLRGRYFVSKSFFAGIGKRSSDISKPSEHATSVKLLPNIEQTSWASCCLPVMLGINGHTYIRGSYFFSKSLLGQVNVLLI